MKQYLELLTEIKARGTRKPAARPNMPGTTSLFGYQFRHNLADGFPLLTSKKLSFKSIIIELLWFLRGDTNVKYLIENGVNIWNEDAYNYYLKNLKELSEELVPVDFDTFIKLVLEGGNKISVKSNYTFGDCGFQYGRVWRNWGDPGTVMIDIAHIPQDFDTDSIKEVMESMRSTGLLFEDSAARSINAMGVDQIAKVLNNLKNNPESRRHVVTAVDPANDNNLALYWCHSLFQFNCRPIGFYERCQLGTQMGFYPSFYHDEVTHDDLDERGVPKYYLDCQMYQRSADVFLGVPYNIASYSLLTHIFAKICNMVPGEYIHTFGDVHIYDNHMDQVDEQLSREPRPLPRLWFSPDTDWSYISNHLNFNELGASDFNLEGYNPHPRIKAKLSTGLK